MADNNAPIGTAGDTDISDNFNVNDTQSGPTSTPSPTDNAVNQMTQAAYKSPLNTTVSPSTQEPQPQAQQPQPTQAPTGQQPTQGKDLANSVESMPDKPDYSNHPAVQRADLLHSVAQTLAGGPRFTTSVDVNTGELKRTPVPLSKADIGMALAMEAIQGSLAGLGVANGPGNLGRAAAAGGAAVAQAHQQVQQQQDETANQDFARHAQIFETNMRLHQNAMTVGRQSFDQNQKYVEQFAGMADKMINEHPEAVMEDNVSESDLSKYNVTKDTAIPHNVTPRFDPNTGHQAVNSYGEPQWDINYLVLKPDFQADNLLSDEDKKYAQKYGLNGFVDGKGNPVQLPKSIPLRISMASGIKSKIAALRMSEDNINDYYSTLNKHDSGESQSLFSMFPKDEDLADFITPHEGSKPTDRSVRNKNPGNLVADASWRGDVDNENLPPGQKVGFRIYHDDTSGRQDLIHQLALDRARTPNITPEEYFKKYSPIPKEASAYAAAARQAAGVQPPQPSSTPHPPVDLVAAVKADPTLPNALEKFQPLLNASSGNYEKAIGALGAKDPAAAGKILSLYGGTSAVHQYDQKIALDQKAAEEAVKNQAEVVKQTAERAAKKQESEADLQGIAQAIAGDPNDPGSGDMASLKYLISQRTNERPEAYMMAKRINPKFNPQEAELKMKTWDAFANDENKPAQSIRSFNTFMDHVGAAYDANNAFQRATNLGTDINRPFNEIKAKYAGDAGNSAQLAAFETELEPAATEFLNLLSNNHALTESDKKAAEMLKDPNQSIATKASVLRAMAQTGAFRIKELNNQFHKVFNSNVPGLISEDSANNIKKLVDEKGQNKTADILADQDVGGTFMGSGNGRGTPGKKLSEVLGRNQAQTPQIPAGKFAARDAKGNIVGYADDNKGTNYHAF